MIRYLFVITIFFLSQSSCKEQKPTLNSKAETITLYAQSRPGGEHFDFDMPIDKGLDHLEQINVENADIDSFELVIGLLTGNESIAIPIRYLSGFEVANLSIEKEDYLVTWCPLVGSARIFEGQLQGDTLGFDFGRGLRDNNLLIVDRKTKSVWNQLSCKSIEGKLSGQRLEPLSTIQSTWHYWRKNYPYTKLFINKDTSDAVFPTEVFNKPYYNTWVPGEPYPGNDGNHRIDNLGLGIEIFDSSIYLPFRELFSSEQPVFVSLSKERLEIHFNEDGLTAWALNSEGELIPSTIVYDWAWQNFFPESKIFHN